MKEYRLAAWPDLPAAFRRTTFHRLLSQLSQRYMSVPKLQEISGLPRQEVVDFIERLTACDALLQRGEDEPDSWFGALQPMNWLRRPTTALPRRPH